MHSDYIMRMIEQFAHALASIIRSRKAGNQEQAIRHIESASQKFLNTDLSFFLQCNSKQLLEHFQDASGQLDTDRSIVCAELLAELSLICQDQQINNAVNHLNMLSLNLYANAIPLDKQFQSQRYKDKAAELIDKMHDGDLSDDVRINIRYYQKFLAKKDK